MEHDPAALRQMRATIVQRRACGRGRGKSWLIYPEAVVIGLVWAVSMAGGIHSLLKMIG